MLWPVWRETHHLTSNLRVVFADRDNAHGECDVDCMGATRDDIVQMISATYRDHFARRDDVWKIKQRDVTIHYFNPIARRADDAAAVGLTRSTRSTSWPESQVAEGRSIYYEQHAGAASARSC